MLSFILFSVIINLFMGSVSSKWTIMAPVFISMFTLLCYSPEFVRWLTESKTAQLTSSHQ